MLFGIVQGGTFEDLRRRCAEALVTLEFPGYAIGGVAVGESKAAIREVTALSAPSLPEEKPRYLMGVGTPADLLASVRAGVDLFDCVLPTRNGRMGHAYYAARRNRDQARALQGGPLAPGSRLCLPGVPPS
jgi:queuine tRNA-ribosyltransferase